MSQTILITGADSGLGRDTAEALSYAAHAVDASMRGAGSKNRTPAKVRLIVNIGSILGCMTDPERQHTSQIRFVRRRRKNSGGNALN
jgi:NAD(P)-dependent dehydrogenase (short-subunit alcohol dehydrogenase family)